jgi:hypothetical protein
MDRAIEPATVRNGLGEFGRIVGAEMRAIKDAMSDLTARLDALEARLDALESGGGELRYAGTWQKGNTYLKGNFVTDRGSLWHAEQRTQSRPGADSTFRLAAKSGTFA